MMETESNSLKLNKAILNKFLQRKLIIRGKVRQWGVCSSSGSDRGMEAGEGCAVEESGNASILVPGVHLDFEDCNWQWSGWFAREHFDLVVGFRC